MSSPTPVSPDALSPEYRNVHVLHATIAQLRTREALITERIERDLREREEVRGALAETEAELETAVLAPVAGGVDPTETVPNEILWMILVQVLAGGTCGRVCRRWHAVCAGATAKKQAWQRRWAGYTHGRMAPTTLRDNVYGPFSLAISSNDTVYIGVDGGDIEVWSTVTNTHLQTLEGHNSSVHTLVVREDGTVYSASWDSTIRIWSGEDGSHLCTIAGYIVDDTHRVGCLAVGADGTVYTVCQDNTIRVWVHGQAEPRHLCTLKGHTDAVRSIALSKDGKLYSGSSDATIRVWSAVDGTHLPSHLGTLEGHTNIVYTVAVGADGTVYSGSHDCTLRVWSGHDGSPVRTLQMGDAVLNIAIGAGNTMLIAHDCHISTWNGVAAETAILCVLDSVVKAMAIGQDGRLFIVCWDDEAVYVL
jgi:WD40 repeat protein